MKTYNKYMKRIAKMVPAIGAAALMLTTNSCERRELYVYQDYFKQVELQIDWRHYDRDKVKYPHTPDPSGMTVWFYPTDGRKADHYTTSEVTRYETYLSQGTYEALVIDYSPEEYFKQEFIGMDYANTAKVQSTPAAYQSPEDEPLYGADAFSKALMKKEANGFWTVYNQPEKMASDTTMLNVLTGKYDHYIPYEERDTYQATLTKQVFMMDPLIIPWQMRIRIPVKGIYYLYETKATVAGLADGYFLAEDHTSDDPCLIEADDWEVYVTDTLDVDADRIIGGTGYIAKTFDTWGLRNSLWANYDQLKNRQKWALEMAPPPFFIEAPQNELRVNIAIKLRDRKTVKYFHIDCGNLVQVFGNEYALSVDLRDVLKGEDIPTLPYVEAVNGMDFGGVVIPWKDGKKVDVGF